MSPSQAERIARVAERKRPHRPAPWHLELRGTQHTLFADDVTVAALAQGLVTARLQCQAAMIARYIEEPEEP